LGSERIHAFRDGAIDRFADDYDGDDRDCDQNSDGDE
jgi:hypothetical protein